MKLRCKICRTYGKPTEELAAELRCSEASIRRWHERGQLKDILITRIKPKSWCKYRRLYGLSIAEIGLRLGKDISVVSKLQTDGRLKKILENLNISSG